VLVDCFGDPLQDRMRLGVIALYLLPMWGWVCYRYNLPDSRMPMPTKAAEERLCNLLP
jgi:hypothetical protein